MYSPNLPPYPTSWYAVAFSDELATGAVVSRTLAGREIVLFRGESGTLGVLDAHCPHLGAHLGRGGAVVGESLRCSFHGFCFDASGACVKTGYDTRPPPKARSRSWPVIERHGIVLVWFDESGAAPDFDIPDVDVEGWTTLRRRTMVVRTHVQEIAENSVDVGHFTWVHGYENVRSLSALKTDGAYLNARYAMRRPRKALGSRSGVDAEFEVHQYGLGYARVEVDVSSLGLRTRQFVLARPLDENSVELHIGMAVRRVENPGRIHPLLAPVPRRWLTERIANTAIAEFEADVRQDLPIWDNKTFINPPALAKGDGPVGPYRRWAKQFHPSARPPLVKLGAA